MSEPKLCPFSKPIIGQYCHCPHARLAERCSGKMACAREEALLDGCMVLAAVQQRYADLAEFPFHEIMPDIQGFNHRRARRKTS